MVDVEQLGISSPPGRRLRASFRPARFNTGGASFPWGARKAGAGADLQHCNRQTHRRGWANGADRGDRQWAPPLTRFPNLPSKPPTLPTAPEGGGSCASRSLPPSLLLCTSCLRQGVGGGMQMQGVVARLGNFGNCHFIHTRHCLGEGAVPGCRILALTSTQTTALAAVWGRLLRGSPRLSDPATGNGAPFGEEPQPGVGTHRLSDSSNTDRSSRAEGISFRRSHYSPREKAAKLGSPGCAPPALLDPRACTGCTLRTSCARSGAMQHPPCEPGNCLSLKEKKITEGSGGVCWGGETDASNPAPALTACCAAEREANVEQGLAGRLLLCNSERRLVRRCKIAGRGRAP
ncbi:uncharacterized protein LOC100995589 [Pan paniscus]|uniref:uncharacterized protein LOC100995589 n=1 Tax=Pan paniscus TaxID=9597 RepID=UPI001560CC10